MSSQNIPPAMGHILRVAPNIAAALRGGHPVVALESSVFAQGLPAPANREAARRMTHAVRSRGVLPAITGVVDGMPVVGLSDDELERFLRRDGIAKLSARDIPLAMMHETNGATTVAAALALAYLAGIDVLATGGIGGVHRDPMGSTVRDESADLLELARTPMVVVCSGAKSILDLEDTVERLESLGLPLVGYQTSELPGFYTPKTGMPVTARADSAADIARAYRAQRALNRSQALIVTQPPPAEYSLPQEVVEMAVTTAIDDARRDHIRGGALTPYLLAAMDRTTAGKSIGVNLALLERNAELAADVAVALANSGGAKHRSRTRGGGRGRTNRQHATRAKPRRI